MNESAFLSKLADITGVPAELLNDSTEIHPNEWESIDVLDIIAAIDESYGTTVPVQALTACRSAGELRNLIRGAAAQ